MYPAIQALYTKYKNEDPHTLYVTKLALLLFDGICEKVKLTDEDRHILEIAALLHDIGYSTDPPNHAAVSTDIVLAEGVDGLTAEQCCLVAAVIRLHQRNLKKALGHPVFKRVHTSLSRVKKLGAILRVADGLDHGHIQDTRIVTVEAARKYCTITIRSGWYQGNLAWAESKADLWNAVMPLRLRLVDKSSFHRHTDYRDVVSPKDSTLQAARKLLYSQYRIIIENRESFIQSEGVPDPEYLHDIRVAVRRFRAVLDLFAVSLKNTEASEINRALDKLGDELGVIRDSNVWIAFLQIEETKTAIRQDPSWAAFFRQQYEVNDMYNEQLQVILTRRDFEQLIFMLVRFLKSTLPEMLRNNEDGSARVCAARQLRSGFERIEAYHKRIDETNSEQMHTLRKLCRKERYWSEFVTPILKGPIRMFSKRLKKMADALGDVHDMDVHLEVLAKSEIDVPTTLIMDMEGLRIKAEKSFYRAWNNLVDKGFRKKIKAHLRQCAEKELA